MLKTEDDYLDEIKSISNEKGTPEYLIGRLINFVRRYKSELIDKFGVDPSEAYQTYVIMTRQQARNHDWGANERRIMSIINEDARHGKGRYYMFGIWYHPDHSLFHHVTKQDVDNISRFIIRDLTNVTEF